MRVENLGKLDKISKYIISHFVGRLLKLIPFKKKMLEYAALMPPRWKTPTLSRLFGAVTRHVKEDVCLRSNLGMTGDYRIALEKRWCDNAAFGRPDHYIGERGALELISSLVKTCNVFIDVGSHIGYFTFFVKAVKKEVPIFYFEPDLALFRSLERNITANHLKNIRGFNVAVGSYDGTAEFFLNSDPLLSSLVQPKLNRRHQVKTVNITRFDTFVHQFGLSNICAKVDIEGAEEQFITGAESVMPRITYCVMEVLEPAVRAGLIQRMIYEFGFDAYYINDYRLEHSPDGSFNYEHPQFNWLFCRCKPEILYNLLKDSRISVVSS